MKNRSVRVTPAILEIGVIVRLFMQVTMGTDAAQLSNQNSADLTGDLDEQEA